MKAAPNYCYILEVAMPLIKKHEYSYARRAAPLFHTYRWKGVAVSNNLEALKNALVGKKNFRIVDRQTGEEVFRTAECPAVY